LFHGDLKKTDNVTSVDVGEIMGLKMLYCLNQRVSQFYPEGIEINIRVEDRSGYYIFEDEGAKAIESSKRYINDFIKLIKILGLNNFITPVKESDLATNEQFHELSDFITQKILAYLIISDESGISSAMETFKALSDIGWKGIIPLEQRQYYYNRYIKLYGCSPIEAREKLAKYLASCLSRHKLNMRGDNPEWKNDFIDLTFCPPIPGVPESLVSKRLYYRTIHDKYTRDHIPPWRGKGYLRIFKIFSRKTFA
jgi:hypothetical protein